VGQKNQLQSKKSKNMIQVIGRKNRQPWQKGGKRKDGRGVKKPDLFGGLNVTGNVGRSKYREKQPKKERAYLLKLEGGKDNSKGKRVRGVVFGLCGGGG